MSQVVAHMGTRQRRHSHYVAFSRVTNMSGLFILCLNENKIAVDPQVQKEMARLRTGALLQLSYTPVYMATQSLKVTFHNVRSLHLHFEDLKSDHNHTAADIITVAETRLRHADSTHHYSIPGFDLIRADQTGYRPGLCTAHRHDDYTVPEYNTGRRPPHGLAAYVSTSLTITVISRTCTPLFESMFFNATLPSSPPSTYTVGVIYKCPHCTMSTFKDNFLSAISSPQLQSPLIILGDFNIDYAKDSSHQIVSWIEQQTGCKQINHHSTTDKCTILDHAYCDVDYASCSTLECSWSDNKALFFCI